MKRFRPILSRLARQSSASMGGSANPMQDLFKSLGKHLLSFCFTKMLKGGMDGAPQQLPVAAHAAPTGLVGANVAKTSRKVLEMP